jgi:hypothetical protein
MMIAEDEMFRETEIQKWKENEKSPWGKIIKRCQLWGKEMKVG